MSSDMNSRSSRAPPAPRGILKNRERDGSRFESQGEDRIGESHQSSMMNPGPGGSWMTGGGVMSGNMIVNPLSSGKEIGLERSLRQKLSEFIAQKADMLFKPLTADEMPLAEVKGTQQNSEDHYGVVPSLDHYLRVDTSEIRRYFFQNVQTGDVLIASVASKNQSGLMLKLVSTDGGKHIVLEDLGIKPFCPSSQTLTPVDPREPDKTYEIGDFVRVEVIDVSADNEKLVCGMKGVTLSPEMQHSFHLGLISRHDLPLQYTLAKAEGESRTKRTYEEMLLSSSGFHNPNNISHLASTMGILSTKNSLMTGLRGVFPAKEMASQLRRIQNAKWAHGNVAEGIKYFKMEKFTEAFQCLNKALSIDAENVEGLVARGALYANSGGFEKAIDDFESALKFNPAHYNARKYLAETLVALGRQQEETGKLEDAVASYSKCLVVKPDHRDAKEALSTLYEKIKKIDLTKLPMPGAAAKITELKEKLKAILQTELGMKLDGKSSKDKKKKKKGRRNSSGSEDGSSSSSSSESDSDSSSSDDSDRKKKKKSKKKKSKKSKKSKKARDESKTRELSLSPFSKRLVDPRGAAGSGLAGFSESTFAEWGQQLGISKQEKKVVDDSDDESKRSGKKSKDKKRSKKKEKRKKRKRGSSSSSTSESDVSRGREKDKKKSKHSSASNTQNTSIEGIIPDLGELEAKLSAYYSKIEQEKIDPVIPPEAVKITVEQNVSHHQHQRDLRPRDVYDTPARKIEVKPKVEEVHERDPRGRDRHQHQHQQQQQQSSSTGGWHETNHGKIELRTDDYGNYIQPENIVRTVHNDTTASTTSTADSRPVKFEMKFKTAGSAPPPPTLKSEPQSNQNESGSKWRPLGSAPPPSDNDKEESRSPVKPEIKNPFEVQRWDGKGKELDRNYRGRKSRSPSPGRRRRGSRSRSYSSSSYSRSRSRSRSRSHSRSPNRMRRNPRGDRDHDRSDRRDYRGDRGRGPVRFFRGFNSRGGRRPFVQRGRTRGNGPSRSRFRNRFSRSLSRSRSRSRSKSRSRRSRTRSRSKSTDRRRDMRDSIDSKERPNSGKDRKESPDKRPSVVSRDEDKFKELEKPVEDEEIQIGGLTTTKASDVEELLDKRKAEKKEELRKSNPDFFRN